MKAIAQKSNALIEKGNSYDIDIMKDRDGYLFYRVYIPTNEQCRNYDIDYLTLAYYFGRKNVDSIKYGCLEENAKNDFDIYYERECY